MKRSLIMAMLAVVLSLCSFPQISFAQQGNSKPLNINVRKGSIITFGSYEQDNNTSNGKEEIQWEVLTVKDGKALCISQYVLDYQPFLNEDLPSATWETCSLRTWLNTVFYKNAFSSEDREHIVNAFVPAHDNEEFSTDAGKGMRDKVFLLSLKEVNSYFGEKEELRAYTTKYAAKKQPFLTGQSAAWWLRTPGKTKQYAVLVMSDGFIHSSGDLVDMAKHYVRPAIWLDVGAASEDTPESGAVKEKKETDNVKHYKTGDTVLLGKYQQDSNKNKKKKIQWVILKKAGDKALLLSKYVLDCRAYYAEEPPLEGVVWENSDIRSWLNSSFYDTSFDAGEKELILDTEVTAQENPWLNADQGKDTTDHVFLLSLAEAETYIKEAKVRSVLPTKYAVSRSVSTDLQYERHASWWLRTEAWNRGSEVKSKTCLMDADSNVNYYGKESDNETIGVRPAMWIDLSSAELIIQEKAEDAADEKRPDYKRIEELSIKDIKEGDIVLFGSYEQDGKPENGTEDIEWIVLSSIDDDGVLLLSKNVLDYQLYYPFKEKDVPKVPWCDTTVRQWLNSEFINKAFSKKEQSMIFKTEVDKDSVDQVFLLSLEELLGLEESSEVFEDILKAAPTKDMVENKGAYIEPYYGLTSWASRPFDEENTNIYEITSRGMVSRSNGSYMDVYSGVRPAIIVQVSKQ